MLNSQQAVVQFPPDYFIGLKSWTGERNLRERAEPEFPGGSVSLKSQLVRMEERRGISSCVFIHSNQESVEQERRLGSEGTLPH